ncbi:MAG: LPS export ABC transporter periplasmic protein LptC [Candidatus Cloacimonetes bacterium]|nr:LPS export ABC transporter periplasmic protein LptC [Candidatus Cloacimonadota bacterium]MCF7815124.1 LPS export ABC transporter periplasmic protein LptC [Candidatus Cloacimonadota bacterium]MCF7869359.1 LPS export ABC transporter periplasmic protein LptC [Candidatus Cloacimonadota bacterium]MCF7884754.1 LPS export ABC transporter periplasmic protein LptC [Candidatus Cloacimonadota bacterium]
MKKLCKSFLIFWKIVSLLILIFLVSCSQEEQQTNTPIEGKIPDEEADSLYVVVTNKDKLEYEMTAVHMYKYYDTKQTFLDSVFLTFFNADGSVKSTLRCDKAEVDEAENIITGIGNVVVESENGIMKAPRAVLNRNTEKIFAEDGVTLIRNQNTLYGEEMVSDMKLEVAEFRKVSAEGTLENEEFDW